MNPILRHALPFALAALAAGCSTENAKDSSSADNKGQAASAPPIARSAATTPAQSMAVPSDRSVYYDFDKADVRPNERGLIESNARYLRDHPTVKVRVEGNADERGSAEYNLALGQRRAESVAKAMKLLGVADNRVEAVSLGKEKPKKTGHDEASWAENRRSDIVY